MLKPFAKKEISPKNLSRKYSFIRKEIKRIKMLEKLESKISLRLYSKLYTTFHRTIQIESYKNIWTSRKLIIRMVVVDDLTSICQRESY